jgi:GT2 family glycosyltransferase
VIDRVAVLIVNYNMPERTDALCEAISGRTKWPHDLCVIDNGSDQQPPSRYTMLRLPKNIQTTGGWLAGLNALKEKYFAYWFIITSARIPDDQGDILTPMARLLMDDENAVGIHPSLTAESTTGWLHLKNRGTNAPRRTWMIDNIASLYRADWFDSIGRFDPAFIYAWGIDLETCYRARKQGRSLWVDDRVQVEKITNIGYTMNRMGMTAEERGRLAYANMMEVGKRKYGERFWELMTAEGVRDEWK